MLVENFIESSNKAGSITELSDQYASAISQLGFTRNCYSVLSNGNSLCGAKRFGLQSNYPSDWMSYYNEKNYIENEPVYYNAPSMYGMVSWDYIENRPATKKQKTILRERREAGLHNGFSLFVIGPVGETIAMSISNDGQVVNTDKKSLSILHAIMQQFNLRFIELCDPVLPVPPPLLSQREKDVLQWAANGKSNGAIADILGISEKTVEFHLSSVFRKLQVSNRILAVLKALNMRII